METYTSITDWRSSILISLRLMVTCPIEGCWINLSCNECKYLWNAYLNFAICILIFQFTSNSLLDTHSIKRCTFILFPSADINVVSTRVSRSSMYCSFEAMSERWLFHLKINSESSAILKDPTRKQCKNKCSPNIKDFY